METNAATSAPETTTTTTPAAAATSTPSAPATPASTPSAAAKADASNTNGKNKFERPTPRQALEQAAAKVRERQTHAAATGTATASAPVSQKAAPAAATGSAPQANVSATNSPVASAKAPPQPTAATATGQQATAPNTQSATAFPADRPRDADGKFKKLPRGWKSALAQQFEALPAEVQEEAHRREDAAYEGIKQYTEGAARWAEMEKAIQPYMATIRQMGASPAQAVQYLFNIDHTLRYGSQIDKQRVMAQVAQTFGVDLGSLAQVPQESQEVAQLRQQLAAMNQQMQQFQQAQGQAQLTPYMAQIQQFKAEQGHEHFDELEPAMTGLIASGAAGTLAEAYEQALWARPDLREKQLASQRQQWEQEQQARVQAAQAASVQVRGAPAAPASAQTIDPKDRRSVLMNAYRNLSQA